MSLVEMRERVTELRREVDGCGACDGRGYWEYYADKGKCEQCAEARAQLEPLEEALETERNAELRRQRLKHAHDLDRAIIRYGAMCRLSGQEGNRHSRHMECVAARKQITVLLQEILPEYDPERWAREADGFVDTAKTITPGVEAR